jgi:hypothetical protein
VQRIRVATVFGEKAVAARQPGPSRFIDVFRLWNRETGLAGVFGAANPERI